MSRWLRMWALPALVTLAGCGKDDDGGDPTPPSKALEGTWRTEGHGYSVRFEKDTVTFYEVTEVSCLPSISGTLEDGVLPGIGLTFKADGDRMLIQSAGTVHIAATRAPLPEVCSRTLPPDDPVSNFEVFWHTFAEQYALFDLYGVDWKARYAQFRPRVPAATTDDALFALLSEMLVPLPDAHTYLVAGERTFEPKPRPAWAEHYLEELTTYVDTHYRGGPGVTVVGGGRLAWKSLNERVGYIYIGGMAGFPGEMSDEGTEMAAAGRAIDEALEALGDKEALIVDVRFNLGGYDAVSLAIASRFTEAKQLAFTKKARAGAGFTPPREHHFSPAGPRQYTRPVYLLTSQVTVSAAEIFTMAMSALPHITVLGERTNGAHSDALSRTLPNGWKVSLSHEVYTAPDGQVYERIGLPPDVELDMDVPSLVAGTDRILQEALQRAMTGG
ncbi:S41 family peptidase [Pyxidicoccus fallax]|uniref:S41 family peptidase n=1 Tax=Pyxidicoccus fallax TaxID=394095 RepID=A0A848LEJ5_9BACT|nr:S41 family peptidase [Pyxidicoccus fallax]NMO15255.1 S41 family peptidase [Pyxidicoccus fallax]NPC77632.1 S41 family peptidase [Pyxidicoccus fallax]